MLTLYHVIFKVACTSGPFSSKIMNGYPILIDHQVEQMH